MSVTDRKKAEHEGSSEVDLGGLLFEGQYEIEEIAALVLGLFITRFALAAGAIIYDLAFDPNAVDVGSRLDALSISPDKRTHHS
jgi:hypothetical protein